MKKPMKPAGKPVKGKNPFELGGKDNDKGIKEGSKADLKRDAKEMKGFPPKKGKK